MESAQVVAAANETQAVDATLETSTPQNVEAKHNEDPSPDVTTAPGIEIQETQQAAGVAPAELEKKPLPGVQTGKCDNSMGNSSGVQETSEVSLPFPANTTDSTSAQQMQDQMEVAQAVAAENGTQTGVSTLETSTPQNVEAKPDDDPASDVATVQGIEIQETQQAAGVAPAEPEKKPLPDVQTGKCDSSMGNSSGVQETSEVSLPFPANTSDGTSAQQMQDQLEVTQVVVTENVTQAGVATSETSTPQNVEAKHDDDPSPDVATAQGSEIQETQQAAGAVPAEPEQNASPEVYAGMCDTSIGNSSELQKTSISLPCAVNGADDTSAHLLDDDDRVNRKPCCFAGVLKLFRGTRCDMPSTSEPRP